MADSKNKNQGPRIVEERLSSFQEYFRANLAFWGFLAVLAIVTYFVCGAVLDDATFGVMWFLFFIMGGGFTLVSVLDYLYEKYIAQSLKEEKK
jgi:hypothetical protein